jgi:RNA recognition motif-containing protein
LTKLYIGNISYDTTAEGLTEHFSQYGTVSNVYVPLDRYSGEPRGFAFLALENSAAERAIAECDGMELDGRSVEVKVSLPRGTKTNRSSESLSTTFSSSLCFINFRLYFWILTIAAFQYFLLFAQ